MAWLLSAMMDQLVQLCRLSIWCVENVWHADHVLCMYSLHSATFANTMDRANDVGHIQHRQFAVLIYCISQFLNLAFSLFYTTITGIVYLLHHADCIPLIFFFEVKIE